MSVVLNKRPRTGSATGRVWEIADMLLKQKDGELPTGREVADVYLAENENHNEGTAFTQYSHWKKAYQNHFKRGPRPEKLDEGVVKVTVAPDGRLVIPASIRNSLGWKAGEELLLKQENGSLLIQSRKTALKKAQELVATLSGGKRPVVEEFLSERREAGRLGE